MRILRFAASAAILLVLMTVTNVTARAADQFTGSWRMIPAKSKFSPGLPPRSLVVTIHSNQNEFQLSIVGRDSNGNRIHAGYKAKFDGKAYPVSGAPGQTVSVERMGPDTVMETLKQGGYVITRKLTVSGDGKTLTGVATGKNANGQPYNEIDVLEKE